MKRPSLSREVSGAITLTIAAVILLSGVWCMWLCPTYDTRKYEDKATWSFTLEPHGTMVQTFEARKGEEFEVYIGSMAPGRVVEVSGKEVPQFPTFSARVYDPTGKLVWTQTNVTSTYFTQLSPLAETGDFKVEVNNPQSEAVSLQVTVRDRTKITGRPLEPVGQWLTLISLPIFGLGAWFIRTKGKVNQA